MKSTLSRLRVLVVAAAVVLAGSAAATASAYHPPKKPGKSSFGNVTKASTTSLTFSWTKAAKPKTAKALKKWIAPKGYEVEQATNYAMTDARVIGRVPADRRTFTAAGLTPGKEYCFQVRAYSKKQVVRVTKRYVGTGKKRHVVKTKYRKIGYGLRGQRFCKTPIVAQADPSTIDATLNFVTYNLCSTRCSADNRLGRSWNARAPQAQELVSRLAPDVLGLEEAPTGLNPFPSMPHMELAYARSAKALMYNTNTFSLAQAGELLVGTDNGQDRYAVWAELILKATQQHLVVWDIHTAPGGDSVANDDLRRGNVQTMLDYSDRTLNAYDRVRNLQGLPAVYMGDFNTTECKKYDSPATLLGAAGYTDSYDLAETLFRPNHNSANQGQAKPILGVATGCHLDRVFVDAQKSRVLEWRNGGDLTTAGQWATPLPSDHNPIRARIAMDLDPAS